MEIIEKLKILVDSAKYDASCSSSGSNRKNNNGIGNGSMAGICHSFASDGRCISLLKILMSNKCIYDCKYCLNRRTNDIKRAEFNPRELADLVINFYKRNYIEGLFLSSGVIRNPDYTMEKMIEVIMILRKEYRFNGYIHAKTIPGASKELIDRMGVLVDRMSINIELPSNNSLKLLAPNKEKNNILKPMEYISENLKNKKSFSPSGQTTQLIIGATPETDYKIMSLSESMYKKFKLKRVYYSAYVGINNDEMLPSVDALPPLKRENRLYQADWLLRYYGYKVDDLLNEENPNFNLMLDPKADYALRNLNLFPVEINKADYETLLKVPGVGVLSAKKIISSRRYVNLDFDALKRLGVVLKRAKYFITCNGNYYINGNFFTKSLIENCLLIEESKNLSKNVKQLSFFGETNG